MKTLQGDLVAGRRSHGLLAEVVGQSWLVVVEV